MKYVKQFTYILAFCPVGELLERLIPLPIPAAIYGMVLLLIALCTGLLKKDAIADTARYLLGVMPLLFVAPCVQLLQHWGLIRGIIGQVILITVLSTWVVFAVSGLVTQLLLKRKDGAGDD